MTSQSSHRFVSLLTRQCLALVLAGGQGGRLHELTKWRPTAAVPFGGKLRIIDFALSNCVNSGIRQIGVLTQYKAHSLIQHLVQGWSRFRRELGESLEILPASQRSGGVWYQGTADAIYQNLDIIRTHRPEYVLVLSGDHVYKMDYGPMLASHVETQAEMTISCVEVPIHEAAGAYGVLQVDDHNRVAGFEEKPAEPKPTASRPDMCLASMGSYVFNTDFLYRKLIEDADDEQSSHEFGKDIIPKLIEGGKVFAYPFRDLQTGACGCWRNVGTLDALWQANMELMSVSPELNLYDLDWPILTHQPQLPPAKFVFNDPERRGMAVDSMVSSGCLISGAHLERTLLFSNVRVHSYAEVEDSLVFPNVDIGSKARIKRAIIDRSCQIPNGMVIGEDHAEDREHGFRISDGGVVLVTPDMLGQSVHLMR